MLHIGPEFQIDLPVLLLPDAIVFRLKLFGSASIEGPDGPLVGRPVQRRRLALLALLAVARQRGLTRDKLIGYLWPDADSERGRALLSDSIYHVNHAVDADALVAIGDELRLDAARLPSDAWEFLEALERRDWERAVELHAEPFLDGFYLPGADELERWVDAQRQTFARERARALEALGDSAERAGDHPGAVRWWRLLAAHDPFSSRVALRLMRALDRSGDPAAALRHARVHSVMLKQELQLEPDADLLAFVAELRNRSRAVVAPPATPAIPDGDAELPSAMGVLAPEPLETGPRPVVVEAPGAGWPRSHGSVTVAAATVLLVLAAVGVRVLMHTGTPLLRLGQVSRVTQNPGLELEPALSPDGRFVAYSGPDGALMVRQVGGPDGIRVVHDGGGAGSWPAWAPDGQSLLFVAPQGIEAVAALGGVPRLLISGTDLGRGLSIAPDGESFAYVSHDSLYRSPITGGKPRLLTAGYEIYSPAWSRDGRRIAYVSGNVQYIRTQGLGNPAPSSVWVIAATGGSPGRVTAGAAVNVSPVWSPTGDLLFVSDREGTRDIYEMHLSHSGVPTGAPVRLTTGLQVHGISVSANGMRLAYSRLTESSNVWSLPVRTNVTQSVSQAQPVTRGDQIIDNIDVSRDGRWLAFNSDVRGTVQLYRLRLGDPAAEPQQLTADTAASYWSDWSPDDAQVAFHRFHGERRQVFVMSVAGGQPVPITDGSQDERSPEWSPDGRRLLLLANWATHPALHLVTRDATGRWSPPRLLSVVVGADTIAPAGLSAWSPDGRFIACGCGPGGLVIIPANGGRARRLPSPYSTLGWDFPQWSADGRTVFHIAQDATGYVTEVVAVPVNGAPPWVAVRFNDPTRPWHRYGFRVRAGRFYFTLGDRESDIWVADIRP